MAQALFVPLSLAVGFAMAASYFLSSSLVPVLSTWILREDHGTARKEGRFEKLREAYGRTMKSAVRFRWLLVIAYVIIAGGIIFLAGPRLGREIFPQVDTRQFQLRFRAPTGTRVEATERMALEVLDEIKRTAGPDNVAITLGYVGIQPASYPIDTIYLWTSGPHEAVLLVALKGGSHIGLAELEERLRKTSEPEIPLAG